MNWKAPALLSALLVAPPLAAAPPASGAKKVDLSVETKPSRGDLDGMLHRGVIRFMMDQYWASEPMVALNKLLLELQDEKKKELEAFEKAKAEGRN